MQTIKILKDNLSEIVAKASQAVKNGSVVVLPFDTVYGFACDPGNNDALQRIFTLKGRDLNKPIGIAVDSINRLDKITHIKNVDFIESHSPGPYTFILPAKDTRFSPFCLKDQTIAVRIPDSELIRNIATSLGGSMAQTSANKAGHLDCGSYEDFLKQFPPSDLDKIDLFIIGNTIADPKPSQIFDLTSELPREIDR